MTACTKLHRVCEKLVSPHCFMQYQYPQVYLACHPSVNTMSVLNTTWRIFLISVLRQLYCPLIYIVVCYSGLHCQSARQLCFLELVPPFLKDQLLISFSTRVVSFFKATSLESFSVLKGLLILLCKFVSCYLTFSWLRFPVAFVFTVNKAPKQANPLRLWAPTLLVPQLARSLHLVHVSCSSYISQKKMCKYTDKILFSPLREGKKMKRTATKHRSEISILAKTSFMCTQRSQQGIFFQNKLMSDLFK